MISVAMDSLDWMRPYLEPYWDLTVCAIFKFSHLGSKRKEEYLILKQEEVSITSSNENNKVPLIKVRGLVGFLRLTSKHLDLFEQVLMDIAFVVL